MLFPPKEAYMIDDPNITLLYPFYGWYSYCVSFKSPLYNIVVICLPNIYDIQRGHSPDFEWFDCANSFGNVLHIS